MRRQNAFVIPALLLLFGAACGGGLPCGGPKDCSGNACCYTIPVTVGGGSSVTCTAAADACPPQDTVEYRKTRLCQTDADCTAGGISTNENVCCDASVMSQPAKACTSPSRCSNFRTAAQDAL